MGSRWTVMAKDGDGDHFSDLPVAKSLMLKKK